VAPHKKKSYLSNDMYDFTKKIAQLWLPAFGTLYFTLAGLWGLPAADEVVGTVVAVDTFLGVLLGLSSAAYPGDGDINVSRNELGEVEKYSLELNEEAENLADKNAVTFKVKEEGSK
jgi:Putative phage holin Dp-1